MAKILCRGRTAKGQTYVYDGVVDDVVYSFSVPKQYVDGLSEADEQRHWKDGLQRCADLRNGKDGGACAV